MLAYLPTESGLRAVNPRYIVMVEPAVKMGESKPEAGRCFVLIQTGSTTRTLLVEKGYLEMTDEIERAMHGLPPVEETEA